MIRKGKRAKITQDGRTIIASRALAYPRIPRAAVAEQLEDELARKGQEVPQREVLERMISRYRSRATGDPEEQPWNLTTLDQYLIPPEALPSVIQVWLVLRKLPNPQLLTIRTAKWISRIYSIYKGKDVSQLALAALSFAACEMMDKVIEIPKRVREDWRVLDIETLEILELCRAMFGEPFSEEYLKWVENITPKLPEELKTVLPEELKTIVMEADNERSHNKAVQE